MIVLGELWWTRRIFTRLWPPDRSLRLDWTSRHPSLSQQTTHSSRLKTAVSRLDVQYGEMCLASFPSWLPFYSFFLILPRPVQWCYHTSAAPPTPPEASWQLCQLGTCWEVYRAQTCRVNSTSSSSRDWAAVPKRAASSGAARITWP